MFSPVDVQAAWHSVTMKYLSPLSSVMGIITVVSVEEINGQRWSGWVAVVAAWDFFRLIETRQTITHLAVRITLSVSCECPGVPASWCACASSLTLVYEFLKASRYARRIYIWNFDWSSSSAGRMILGLLFSTIAKYLEMANSTALFCWVSCTKCIVWENVVVMMVVTLMMIFLCACVFRDSGVL